MSLRGHQFVIVPFETTQKLSLQFFEKERDRAYVHVSIYIYSLKCNDSTLLLQTFEWSEFCFINVDIQLVYLIVIIFVHNFWIYP